MDRQANNQASPEKEFTKLFESLTYRHYKSEVFRDFLDYSLTYFIQGATSDSFSELDKKWGKELPKFQQMFLLYGEMAQGPDGNGFHDCLGDMFMELIARTDAKYKGQFFTPIDIANLIAMMQYGDDLKPGKSVSDPACGSGRMLLAMAKLERGLIFYAADVDQMCCKMTALNMLVNSLTAEVAWMNSITMEHYDTWHCQTRSTLIGRLPYYIKVDKEHTGQIQMWEEQRRQWEAEDKDKPIVGKRNQIQLF